MGRPLLLSTDLIKKVATAIRMGATKEMAMMPFTYNTTIPYIWIVVKCQFGEI